MVCAAHFGPFPTPWLAPPGGARWDAALPRVCPPGAAMRDPMPDRQGFRRCPAHPGGAQPGGARAAWERRVTGAVLGCATGAIAPRAGSLPCTERGSDDPGEYAWQQPARAAGIRRQRIRGGRARAWCRHDPKAKAPPSDGKSTGAGDTPARYRNRKTPGPGTGPGERWARPCRAVRVGAAQAFPGWPGRT